MDLSGRYRPYVLVVEEELKVLKVELAGALLDAVVYKASLQTEFDEW